MIDRLRVDDDDLDEDENLDDLHNPRLSKRIYSFMRGLYGSEWGNHLAFHGGVLDQPLWFWHDMIVISEAERIAKELLKNAGQKWSRSVSG